MWYRYLLGAYAGVLNYPAGRARHVVSGVNLLDLVWIRVTNLLGVSTSAVFFSIVKP